MSERNSRNSAGSKHALGALKGSPASSERNSPSGTLRDGVLSSLGQLTPNSKLSSSGRLAGAQDRGKVEQVKSLAIPRTRSSAPDFKSHSFHGVSSVIGGTGGSPVANRAGGLRSSATGTATTLTGIGSPARGLDLGAALTRRTAAATFAKAMPLVASLPSPVMSRSKGASPQTPTPAEGTFTLDDMTFTYGHSSFQGARDYQEDTVTVLSAPSAFLGGVFDGHGGDEVSKELERVLLQNIHRRVTEATTRTADDIRVIENALRAAYLTTNEEIGLRLDKAQEAGSCAVTFMVRRINGRPYLFCANAGDCRAVLCSQGNGGTRRATRMSEDHKPQPGVCPSEIARVCDAGGCVLWGRVQGCLAVSRAFGDRTLQPYVIADPHIESRALDPDRDMFMYLASDGVTDMVDDLQGCNIVAEQLARGGTAAQAAQALVSSAYHKGSCDNISVLVVRMRKRQPGDPAPTPALPTMASVL